MKQYKDNIFFQKIKGAPTDSPYSSEKKLDFQVNYVGLLLCLIFYSNPLIAILLFLHFCC